MKTRLLFTIVLVAGLFLAGSTFNNAYGQTTPKTEKKAKEVKYTCPMHPEVLASKPGKCPKCGMDMVEKKEVKKDGTKKKPTDKEKSMSM